MKNRWGVSRPGMVLVATLAAIVAAGGVMPMAMADNSGRRICLYGSAVRGDEQHFAVSDFKKEAWMDWNAPCPPGEKSDFLAAINWDEHNTSYKWEKYPMDKMECEEFLDQYLKGVIPADFQEKRRDYFCDNTDDDTLYEFVVKTTAGSGGQFPVEVKATKTNVRT